MENFTGSKYEDGRGLKDFAKDIRENCNANLVVVSHFRFFKPS